MRLASRGLALNGAANLNAFPPMLIMDKMAMVIMRMAMMLMLMHVTLARLGRT